MDVYDLDGKVEKSIELPKVFSVAFREDLVRRALLAEQSLAYQPQGHNLLAGLRTTAVYVGNYKSYRTGRHMGIAIRPRQKLGGGAQGDVRRIPSATKGRRAHPHKIEKNIEEAMNRKEYVNAIRSAIAGCTAKDAIKQRHRFAGNSFPIIVDNKIEAVAKTKDLMKFLNAMKLGDDLDASHKPKLRRGLKRLSKSRHFRNSAILIVKDPSKVGRAGRNIPGVDVVSVDRLTVAKLAPGAIPRLSIWTEGALNDVEQAVEKSRLNV